MEAIALGEGLRMFLRNIRARIKGIRKYNGSAEQICGQITKDCWNGKYFQVSRSNYPLFYTRDFSFCTESLMKLGYKEEVNKSLNYAISCFKQKNVSVAINRKGKPFDFPYYAVDSLPLFLRSLRVSKNSYLIKESPEFFNKQIELFFNLVVDKETGLVRKDRAFSSIRDYSVGKSSCYDNVMAALLSDELKKLDLINPLKGYNHKKIIKDNFWNGSYFKNDLEADYVCADANIFPYWAEIFTDKKMMAESFNAMQNEALDVPFPAKYSKKGVKQKMIPQEIFVPNWERNMVWSHLGMLYIKELEKIDRKKAELHIMQYRKIIEKYGNFIELFTEEGKPYSSLFYHADEGMLWSSMFLGLTERK